MMFNGKRDENKSVSKKQFAQDLKTVTREFRNVDKDGNGKLDVQEMIDDHKTREDYEDLPDWTLLSLVDTHLMFADEDGDNMLSFDEVLLLNQYPGSDEKNPSATQLIKMMFNGMRDQNKSVSKKQFAQYLVGDDHLRDEELLTPSGVEQAAKITEIIVKMAEEDEEG